MSSTGIKLLAASLLLQFSGAQICLAGNYGGPRDIPLEKLYSMLEPTPRPGVYKVGECAVDTKLEILGCGKDGKQECKTFRVIGRGRGNTTYQQISWDPYISPSRAD